MNSASSLSVLCVSAMALGCGMAQAAAPATAAEPEVTTVTYGDWVVRCQQAAGAARQCEALQTLAIDGRAIARLAVVRLAPSGDLAVAVFAQWQAQTVPGALGYVDGNGNAVTLPFSFRGLSQAIEGLGPQ